MFLQIHPVNPEQRKIDQVVSNMKNGAVIIYPTDSIYGLGCDIFNKKAIERICRIRNLNPQKANLTIICRDISQLAEYTQQLDNAVFKIIKKHTPGPFTFILKAGRKLPKAMDNRRKTLGLRIPDHPIAQSLIEALGNPILSISLKSDDEITEYLTDPFDIQAAYGKQVDIIIDGGIGDNLPSTVVDLLENTPKVIRQAKGDFLF